MRRVWFVIRYMVRYRVSPRYALWAHSCLTVVARDVAALPLSIVRKSDAA